MASTLPLGRLSQLAGTRWWSPTCTSQDREVKSRSYELAQTAHHSQAEPRAWNCWDICYDIQLWSKFCTDNGIRSYGSNWLEFLDGFDPESDEIQNTCQLARSTDATSEYTAWSSTIRTFVLRCPCCRSRANRHDRAASTKDTGTELPLKLPASYQARLLIPAATAATEAVQNLDSPAPGCQFKLSWTVPALPEISRCCSTKYQHLLMASFLLELSVNTNTNITTH